MLLKAGRDEGLGTWLWSLVIVVQLLKEVPLPHPTLSCSLNWEPHPHALSPSTIVSSHWQFLQQTQLIFCSSKSTHLVDTDTCLSVTTDTCRVVNKFLSSWADMSHPLIRKRLVLGSSGPGSLRVQDQLWCLFKMQFCKTIPWKLSCIV